MSYYLIDVQQNVEESNKEKNKMDKFTENKYFVLLKSEDNLVIKYMEALYDEELKKFCEYDGCKFIASIEFDKIINPNHITMLKNSIGDFDCRLNLFNEIHKSLYGKDVVAKNGIAKRYLAKISDLGGEHNTRKITVKIIYANNEEDLRKTVQNGGGTILEDFIDFNLMYANESSMLTNNPGNHSEEIFNVIRRRIDHDMKFNLDVASTGEMKANQKIYDDLNSGILIPIVNEQGVIKIGEELQFKNTVTGEIVTMYTPLHPPTTNTGGWTNYSDKGRVEKTRSINDVYINSILKNDNSEEDEDVESNETVSETKETTTKNTSHVAYLDNQLMENQEHAYQDNQKLEQEEMMKNYTVENINNDKLPNGLWIDPKHFMVNDQLFTAKVVNGKIIIVEIEDYNNIQRFKV